MVRSLLALAVLGSALFAQSGKVAIVGASVIDGTGTPPVNATIVLQGERIVAVGKDVPVPPDARVIRADGLTVLPGLFDLHTHLPYSAVSNLTGDWPKSVAAYLLSGVTSTVDFGTYGETFQPMRELVAQGKVAAPRLHLAARLTTPGGHGAEAGRGDLFSLEVLTPREARAAVQRVLPYRPDVIKVFTDGWRYGAATDMTSMEESTLKAIVDEAHQHQLPVLTHTVTLARAKIAARAGVDVIAHGVGDADVDQELINLMKAHGTTYVSTLAVYEPRGRDLLTPSLSRVLEPLAVAGIQPPLTPPGSGPALRINANRAERWAHLQHNILALHRAGIRLGVGTDAGVTGTYHGWATLRELKLLVGAGLTPLEAITAGTRNSAQALHVDGDRGTIAAGQKADLLLVEGRPQERIEDVAQVRRLFLNGREVDLPALTTLIASRDLSPLASARVPANLDQFESSDGLSALHTLWVNSTDSEHDHSRMSFQRTLREGRGHAMTVLATMAEKDKPYARVNLPLQPGALVPADASAFKGVEFLARGEGEYRLLVPTRNVRDGRLFQKEFRAEGKWRRVRIPFAALQQPGNGPAVPWTARDLLMLSFELARPAGRQTWLELDDVRFYR